MTNDDIDEMIKPYIYESPDHGDTVTRRKFGETDKEQVSLATDDNTVWIDTDDNTIIVDSASIMTGHGYLPGDMSLSLSSHAVTSGSYVTDGTSDITLDVNGESRKVSELFASVDAIEKRLQILRPNPELLEKYEMLQSLYDQYKAAEALLYEAPDVE